MNTMNYILLVTFAKGFIEKDLLLLNSYLLLENRILRSKLGKRVKLTDSERIKLANAAKDLARIATIAKVDTIRKWYHEPA